MKNINKYLRKHKITMAELCRRGDLNYSSVKKYRVRGLTTEVTFEMAMKIANGLNITLEQLYKDILNEE